jgi:glycosyltransferase involved in cell wall biosynthesis
MKILYTIHSLYNPGGMERVLLNKATYLTEKLHWDVTIVTTDQNGRPPFYPFPEGVRMIDLGVNYSDDNGKGFFAKFMGYMRRKRKHKRLFVELLKREKPDVVDCFYPGECGFVPGLKDGSKKVLELHQSKLFHHQYNRTGFMGLADKVRARMDERLVRRFDRFVVLTEEDAQMWGALPNIVVIPNAAMAIDSPSSEVDCKRVIAVGRLDYQKGFDRLIEAWNIVQQSPENSSWQLDIYGQGEWKEMLQGMIEKYNLQRSARINAPTTNIGAEYSKSAMLVMSSHYEGFPMVMVEAMAHGLPVVSFDYKCGPRDIIDHGVNGLIVPDGDIAALAAAMQRLMSDEKLRKDMSLQAKNVVNRYSEEKVMRLWVKTMND